MGNTLKREPENMSKSTTAMVLVPELVPYPLWGMSLARKGGSLWQFIRLQVYEDSGHMCAICKCSIEESRNFLCHEVWNYDDVAHVQELIGFQGLCHNCSSIKHIKQLGAAMLEGHVTREEYNAIIEHALKVNKCTQEQFDVVVDNAALTWAERSVHDWVQVLSYVEEWKVKYATLKQWMKTHTKEVTQVAERHGLVGG